VRALGFTVPGTFREFIELSEVAEDKDLPADEQAMLQNLLDSHEVCSKEARKVHDAADDAEDVVTADLMVRRMDFHDKAAWMLRALLTETQPRGKTK
jgi:starvation-inducible DNA-binding protein